MCCRRPGPYGEEINPSTSNMSAYTRKCTIDWKSSGSVPPMSVETMTRGRRSVSSVPPVLCGARKNNARQATTKQRIVIAVSYTHLRAHETPEHLVCRLL